jgi:hypothetical protein
MIPKNQSRAIRYRQLALADRTRPPSSLRSPMRPTGTCFARSIVQIWAYATGPAEGPAAIRISGQSQIE